MTNFKQYFRLHLKTKLRPIICILAVVLILTFLIGVNEQPTKRYDHASGNDYLDYTSTIYVPVLFMCVLVYILPVLEFSFFKKRINLDLAYSLPISRRAMGAVHYLSGLSILLGTFTLSYLTNFALLLSRGSGYFDFAPMIEHYLLCLVLGAAMYSVLVFVFNEANTKGDGIWFMLLYSYAFYVIFYFVAWFFTKIVDIGYIFLSPYCAIIWGPISRLTTNYRLLIEIDWANSADFWQSPEEYGWFAFWIVIGIASAVGFFLTFGKRRMEKTEEISDSFFGFRVLIPVYAICEMFYCSSVLSWVIACIPVLLGYVIYRRGFHFKKSDVIILCSILIGSFVVSFL